MAEVAAKSNASPLFPAGAPDVFRVAMPDNSMEPVLRTGCSVKFDSRLTARSGDCVLVKDSTGAMYIRMYRPVSWHPDGGWQAYPLDDDYDALESVRDGLSVVAVMVGWDLK